MTTSTRTKYTVQATVEIPEQLLEDVLITAFDGGHGGCWFWAEPYPGMEWLETMIIVRGGAEHHQWMAVNIQVDSDEVDEQKNLPVAQQGRFRVNYGIIALGIQRIMAKFESGKGYCGGTGEALRQALFDGDGGGIDANMADSIVQQGLWNDEVFG